MLLKHKDMSKKRKQIDTTPIDYAALNKLYKDFETRFVPQTELSAEQAFWSHNSVSSSEPDLSDRPTNVEKEHAPTAITEGTWGFEHTKACFRDEIIPFVKALKDLFSTVQTKQLVDELLKSKIVFYQMETGCGNNYQCNTKKEIFYKLKSSTHMNKSKKKKATPRKVKSSLKNKDHVVAPKGTAHVQHSKLNANSELNVLRDNGNVCPLTRITTTIEAPIRKPVVLDNETSKPAVTLVYSRKPRNSKTNVLVSKSKVLQSVSVNKKEPSKSWGSIIFDVLSSSLNACRSSKLSSVKFGNDHVAKNFNYFGDYQIGNVTISRVYYVEGLGHNLFSVGQFCDSNLEVAFRQHTCFIHNLEGVDLLTGSRGNNLYTLSLRDMMASSPICLLSKASKTNKKKPHKPKSKDTNQEKLYLLHMDLCGPMRVASVNGKKYILVIVDDYSRFTWVKFLRSKDEALDFIIKFLKMIQLRLKVPVRCIRTDNGTEFVNQTLREYYEKVGISHETSVARSPQQNGVVERRNRTLIEAARTMLIYAKAPLFLWAEAVATACYTQNRSIIRLRHGKTPYELLHDKLPDLSFFYVFGALCYPTNDSENLGKLQPKADIGIFIGYAPTKKAF
ncbi:retrovirus-related pol polyprotein from transposon TNT 1-94 [Tanacetum coccineum]